MPQADGPKEPSSTVSVPSQEQPSRSDIDRSSGVAVWRQIAEDLTAEIASGRLNKGARLPTEEDLAAHYGVNRHTLRRAIAEITRHGLVTASPRRGTFVTGNRISYPISVHTRFSENIAQAGFEPGGRLLSSREATAPEEMSLWLGIAAKAKVIELTHMRSGNDVPICLTTAWFPADRFGRIPHLYERLGSITKALQHLKVSAYERRRTRISAMAATPEERDLLGLERGAILLVTHTLDVDGEGEPIQASRSRFVAERVDLLVET